MLPNDRMTLSPLDEGCVNFISPIIWGSDYLFQLPFQCQSLSNMPTHPILLPRMPVQSADRERFHSRRLHPATKSGYPLLPGQYSRFHHDFDETSVRAHVGDYVGDNGYPEGPMEAAPPNGIGGDYDD